MHKTRIFVILLLSLFFCSCLRAPTDYYYKFILIEKWGMERREETQRKITDVVVHPEQNKPLIDISSPEEKKTEFRGMIHLNKSEPSKIKELDKSVKSKVPVAIDREFLNQALKKTGFDVVLIRIVNGRLEGKENLVRVNFTPQSLYYDSIYKQFLKLCAIVEAAQTQKGTVDRVNAIVEEDNKPYMILESSIENYKAYMNEEISLEEWISNLEIEMF